MSVLTHIMVCCRGTVARASRLQSEVSRTRGDVLMLQSVTEGATLNRHYVCAPADTHIYSDVSASAGSESLISPITQ